MMWILKCISTVASTSLRPYPMRYNTNAMAKTLTQFSDLYLHAKGALLDP